MRKKTSATRKSTTSKAKRKPLSGSKIKKLHGGTWLPARQEASETGMDEVLPK